MSQQYTVLYLVISLNAIFEDHSQLYPTLWARKICLQNLNNFHSYITSSTHSETHKNLTHLCTLKFLLFFSLHNYYAIHLPKYLLTHSIFLRPFLSLSRAGPLIGRFFRSVFLFFFSLTFIYSIFFPSNFVSFFLCLFFRFCRSLF
jgi:hypothetical protein